MRADRLIALLLLLQRRGTVTAAEVATELEVSERTARRDLEALMISGVPLYPRRGRGGGWQLIGGARTDLTGLTEDEMRAVFVAIGPTAADTPVLRSALAKLSAALPETFRARADTATAAIRVDPAPWGRTATVPEPEWLDLLVRAVVAERRILVDYDSARRTKGTRVLDPLGLVCKGTHWYLVATEAVTEFGTEAAADGITGGDTGGAQQGGSDMQDVPAERGREVGHPEAPDHPAAPRSYRVDRIRSAEILPDPAWRPVGFDLDATWAAIAERVETLRAETVVEAVVRGDVLAPLHWVFGAQCNVIDPATPRVETTGTGTDASTRPPSSQPGGPTTALPERPRSPVDRIRPDHVRVRLTERGATPMAAMLAGFGDAVELVDAPPDVLVEMRRIAAALADRYLDAT